MHTSARGWLALAVLLLLATPSLGASTWSITDWTDPDRYTAARVDGVSSPGELVLGTEAQWNDSWRLPLLLEDARFNHRFKIRTHDDDFAITLLTPEMQTFMLTKTTVRWRLGAGHVCLVYGGKLKPARMEASLDRLRGFWSNVPVELESW